MMILTKQPLPETKGAWVALTKCVTEPYGLLLVITWACLFGVETYHCPATGKDGEWLCAGGVFSFLIGLAFLRQLYLDKQVWERFLAKARGGKAEAYVTVTDEFVETGVAGCWFQRLQWTACTGWREFTRGFELEMGGRLVYLEKNRIGDEQAITAFRDFLRSKAPLQ